VFESLKRIADPDIRASLIGSLTHCLSADGLREALNIAIGTPDARSRSLVILSLAPLLPSDLLREAVYCLIHDESCCVDTLAALFPILPKDLLMSILTSKHCIFENGITQSIFRRIIGRIMRQDDQLLLSKIVVASKLLSDEFHRAAVLSALAPHLSISLLHAALDVARAIEDDLERVVAMAALAAFLPASEKQHTFAVILCDANGITLEHHRVSALVRMIQYIPPEQREQALRATIEAIDPITDPPYRARALAKLAPHLPPTLLNDAITAALGVRDEKERTWVLAELALHSPPELLDLILAAAKNLEDELHRATVFLRLLDRVSTLSEPIIADVLRDLIEVSLELPRHIVMDGVGRSAKAAFQLGVDDAILEMYRAVQDASEWYP